MEIASQIGLKAQRRCKKNHCNRDSYFEKYKYIVFFLYFLRPHMAAIFGQFPANFRFSGAMPSINLDFYFFMEGIQFVSQL